MRQMSFRIFICLSPTNQGIQGTGIALIPMALVFVLVSPLSGLLTGKVGSRLMTAGGAAVIGCGLLLIAPTATVRVDHWRRDRPCPDGARDGPCHRGADGRCRWRRCRRPLRHGGGTYQCSANGRGVDRRCDPGGSLRMAHGGAKGLPCPHKPRFRGKSGATKHNVTGFTTFEPTMGSKRLEVLKEVAPRITRVALLFNPDTAQLIKALGVTIRAMAGIGTLDSQVGARICNGLGIMRACLETQKLEQLESRMDEIADRVALERTGAARERGPAPMKPSAFRIERLLANVEAEVERRGLRRAGTSFILTRSLRQKRKACPTCSCPGF